MNADAFGPDGRVARGAGSEARRALLATLLGLALGVLIAAFSKRDEARG